MEEELTNITNLSSKLSDTPTLIGQAWFDFKADWDKLIILQIFPLVGAVIVTFVWLGLALLLGLVPGFGLASLGNLLTDSTLTGYVWLIIVVVFIGWLLTLMYVIFWGQAALIIFLDQRDKDMKLAFQQGRSRAVNLAVFSLIEGLIVLVGFLLLIVPGIIWSLWYGLGHYAVVLEEASPRQALTLSKKYVRKDIWWYIGKILIWTILVMLINLILSEVLKIEGLTLLVGFILSIMTSIYMFLIYQQMRLYSVEND